METSNTMRFEAHEGQFSIWPDVLIFIAVAIGIYIVYKLVARYLPKPN